MTAHAQNLMCPVGASTSSANANASALTSSRHNSATQNAADQPVIVEADGLPQATANGVLDLSGNVVVTQGERSLRTDSLHLDQQQRTMETTGPVEYEDASVLLSGDGARINTDGGAEVANTRFLLKANAGRGSAARIEVTQQGNLALDAVSYTTCPPAVMGWSLELSDLDINQATRTGTGRNVKLRFGGVPIFYTPWLSFPVGNQRKSGVLYPSLSSSSRGGRTVSVPWYWNLAANYDDTITPTIDTARGFKLDNEFRHLSATSKTQLSVGYLPHDNLTHDWRGAAELTYRNDFSTQTRLNVNASETRDNEWYEDFGQGRDRTSQVYLFRTAELNHYSSQWYGGIQLQQLQTIDTTIANTERPYTRLPGITFSGQQALPFGWNFALDSEAAYFTQRSDQDASLAGEQAAVSGSRWYLAPTLSMPLRAAGFYLTPSAGWRYTGYALQHTQGHTHPSLSAPVYSLDTGFTLERLNGRQQQRLLTLEPRLLYAYVPYRDQSELPLFDTGMPDLTLTQLFNTNRFVGPDRLGDSQQLSMGFTSRLLSLRDGQQYLSGTLGQAFYFKSPCVTALTSVTCTSSTTRNNVSDIIGQLNMYAYKNVSMNVSFQWDPDSLRSERNDVSLQYRQDGSRVVNLAYRFNRGSVKQWESSFAWPLNSSFSGYGKVVYSRLDQKFLDHFAGLEYRSCCWNIRAVVGRAVTTRSGAYDTQFKLQLELKGLSSVGTADSFLQGAISGYSAKD